VTLAAWSGPGRDAGAAQLDASARWAEALRGDAPTRDAALRWLRAHLSTAAKFELDRRGIARDGVPRAEAAWLVRGAADAALAAILADLDRYRAQSAFTTWTAKYAIRAAAAAARARSFAADRQRNKRHASSQLAHPTKPPTIAP
jgi:hypothetical protein